MRINRNDSQRRDGNYARGTASTKATTGGYGATVAGGTGSVNGDAKETKARRESLKDLFEPIDTNELTEISDCPGGVCPVPWATDTSGNDEPKETSMPPVLINNINHPSHYTEEGGVECIEAIEAQLTFEEYEGFLRGNCVKYLWRWKNKGGVEDLKKCRWYLDRLIEVADAEKN